MKAAIQAPFATEEHTGNIYAGTQNLSMKENCR